MTAATSEPGNRAWGLAAVLPALACAVLFGCSEDGRPDGASEQQKDKPGLIESYTIGPLAKAELTAAMGNLKAIGSALASFAAGPDQAFPPDLKTLVDGGLLGRGALKSVGDRGTSLIYVPGVTSRDAGSVVVYDPHVYGGEMAFLTADGSVGSTSAGALKQRLKEQRPGR